MRLNDYAALHGHYADSRMYLRPEDTSGGMESTALASESKEFKTFNMTQTAKSSIDAGTQPPAIGAGMDS